MKKRFIRWVIYRAITTIIFLLKFLPYNISIKIGGFLGTISYYALPNDRKQALLNLDLAFGKELSIDEKKNIAKETFQNTGRNLFAFISIDKIAKRFDQYVSIHGRGNLDSALAIGKGALWLSGHIGNWEITAAYVASLGYPVSVVSKSVYDPRLGDLLIHHRENYNVYTIFKGDLPSAKGILKSLKQNRIVAILIDQHTDARGEMVKFFGQPAFVPTAPASIATRWGIPILMGFTRSLPDGRHEIFIEPPIILEDESEVEAIHELPLQMAGQLTSKIEEFIRRYPDQWVWFHRRWK